MKKFVYYILDFVFLILSYYLCDLLTEKFNLFIGIIIGLTFYIVIYYLLGKIFKIDNFNIKK